MIDFLYMALKSENKVHAMLTFGILQDILYSFHEFEKIVYFSWVRICPLDQAMLVLCSDLLYLYAFFQIDS